MNTKINDAAIEAGCSKSGITSRAAMRIALEDALPHMQQADGGGRLRDRTPADYAIEHAGYLVTAANQLIEARDELDGLTLREEECGDVEDEEVEAAEQSVRDATSCLRLAIHEFEKRRNRALAATGKQQGGEAQTNTPAHKRISSVIARLKQCEDSEAAELIELMYAAGVEAEQEILAARQAVDLGQVIEQIAQQWDGCSYDAVGETIDIGQAIRAAGKRLAVNEDSDVSKAMDRCINDLQSLIDVAHDYDFDEMTVQALKTAIESMELRKRSAQAVDLEQFRSLARSWIVEAGGSAADTKHACADELMALIDGK